MVTNIEVAIVPRGARKKFCWRTTGVDIFIDARRSISLSDKLEIRPLFFRTAVHHRKNHFFHDKEREPEIYVGNTVLMYDYYTEHGACMSTLFSAKETLSMF